MKITIGFELESGVDGAELMEWLNGVLAGGEPVKSKKSRKARKPMTDEEKAAFRAKMVAGQEAKAAERAAEEANDKKVAAEKKGEEMAKGSKSAAAKTPASKRKRKAKK
jgi:hypothetical protein